MCVKLFLRDLNPNPYPSHPTNTYTCGVTIALRVCSGIINKIKLDSSSLILDYVF